MNNKYFNIAIKHALLNPYRFQHAAVFVPKKGNGYYVGLNTVTKSHPISKTRYFDIHAELAVLIKIGLKNKEKIHGGEIYIVRVKKVGLGMSKPCPHCATLLKKYNIKKVYYSTPFGFEKL